jgi:hypothetical protein
MEDVASVGSFQRPFMNNDVHGQYFKPHIIETVNLDDSFL